MFAAKRTCRSGVVAEQVTLGDARGDVYATCPALDIESGVFAEKGIERGLAAVERRLLMLQR